VAVIGSGEGYEADASRLKRSRVLVTIGSPIDPVDFQEMEDPSAAMMSAWANWIGGILGTGAGG
jgi:hypothetical protein